MLHMTINHLNVHVIPFFNLLKMLIHFVEYHKRNQENVYILASAHQRIFLDKNRQTIMVSF